MAWPSSGRNKFAHPRYPSKIFPTSISCDKQRRPINLETKLKILDLLEKKVPVMKLADFYDLPESSIRTIGRDKWKIRFTLPFPHYSDWRDSGVYARTKSRIANIELEDVERLLLLWIDDQAEKLVTITPVVVRKKAVEFFDYFSKDKPKFIGSSGWYDRFKVRYDLGNKVKGHSAFKVYHQVANARLATLFIFDFNRYIETEQYSPAQIFCVKETKLFWKKLPGQAFEAAIDRMTVVLCSNMAANLKLKPFVVLKTSDISKPLPPSNGREGCSLPVHWYCTGTSWMHSKSFQEWLEQTFVPEAKSFCKTRGIPFKILLLMDKAPSHQNLPEIPDVTIMYLPHNTDYVINPMNHGIISEFHIGYLRKMMEVLLANHDAQAQPNMSDHWNNFTKINAIELISQTWNSIPEATMKEAWAYISEIEEDTDGRKLRMKEEIEMCLQLYKTFVGEKRCNLSEADILEFLESHDQELSVKELLSLCEAVPSKVEYPLTTYRNSDATPSQSACSSKSGSNDKKGRKINLPLFINNVEIKSRTEDMDEESDDIDVEDVDPTCEIELSSDEASNTTSIEHSSLDGSHPGMKIEDSYDENEEKFTILIEDDENLKQDSEIKVESLDNAEESYKSTHPTCVRVSSSDVIEISDDDSQNVLEAQASSAKRIKLSSPEQIKTEPFDLGLVKTEDSEEETKALLGPLIENHNTASSTEDRADLIQVLEESKAPKIEDIEIKDETISSASINTDEMPTAAVLESS